jgi:DNA polymerase-3 subunit delta'
MTEAPSHPRDSYDLLGAEAAEGAFAEAQQRGRLHHAWLLAGPEGVGKATFAYRAARRLLGAAPDPTRGLLGARPDDPVSRLIAQRAHPDLLVLQRDPEDGRARKQIPVDEARELPAFFAKTPAIAAWRVAIIDTANDLNLSGANALLKTLEEPPERGVILLVCHRPGALLATIRSRCRMLKLPPVAATEAAAWLSDRLGLETEAATQLAAMAKGALGRAWRLAGAGAIAADTAARDLLAALPRIDAQAAQALANGFRGGDGGERFDVLIERLAAQVHDRTCERAAAGENDLEPWAEAFTYLSALGEQVGALNLDRADAFYAALARLAAAAC